MAQMSNPAEMQRKKYENYLVKYADYVYHIPRILETRNRPKSISRFTIECDLDDLGVLVQTPDAKRFITMFMPSQGYSVRGKGCRFRAYYRDE